MPPRKALAPPRDSTQCGPLFSITHANRALVLVRRITADIVARHRQLLELRAGAVEPEGHLRGAGGQSDFPNNEAVQEQIDHCVAQLHRLNRELESIGCVLKDARMGLVDFPAVHEGRRIWLCWKLGEPEVAHWHEWNAGYSGRRPIGELLPAGAGSGRDQPVK